MKTLLICISFICAFPLWAFAEIDEGDREDYFIHPTPDVYDNAYIVDTIEINNPRVLSFGRPDVISDLSFVADSALVSEILKEIRGIKKWKGLEKYLKSKNSLINSCYVYLLLTVSEEYDYPGSFFLMRTKRKMDPNAWQSISYDYGFPLDDGEIAGYIEGEPICVNTITPSTDQFILVLVNAGYINNWCMDCSKKRYTIPAFLESNTYVKMVYPLRKKGKIFPINNKKFQNSNGSNIK